jgi:hypothetical protein
MRQKASSRPLNAECQTARAAIARAEVLARTKGGAVAFLRTGDPQLGEFDPAEVLATFGEVPADLSEL